MAEGWGFTGRVFVCFLFWVVFLYEKTPGEVVVFDASQNKSGDVFCWETLSCFLVLMHLDEEFKSGIWLDVSSVLMVCFFAGTFRHKL